MRLTETGRPNRRSAWPLRATALFYILLFVALIWPVYPNFAKIEPRIIGLPFSLFYVVAGLLMSFVVLGAYYWRERHARPEDENRSSRPLRTSGGTSEEERV